MAKTSDYLVLDLGAESGRGLLGRFDGERLTLDEVHRFANGPVRLLDTLHWDLLRLADEIKTALRKAAATDRVLDGVGVDTWGVDFGLIGRGETLLGNPVHYRDARTEGMLEAAFRRVPRERIYEITGLQFMPFNTLYQLLALRLSDSPLLEVAETLLMMPDLLAWLLTGRRVGERTNASTTQLLDPRTGRWSDALCAELNLPRSILPELVEPGTELGPLRPALAEEVGLTGPRLTVLAPATHDTASAVAAVPVVRPAGVAAVVGPPDWCYLSSGTWSLLGVEVPQPVITAETLRPTSPTRGAWWGPRACSRTSWDSGWCRSAAGPGPGRGATTATTSFWFAPRRPGRSPPWSTPMTRHSSRPVTCPPAWRPIAPGPARSRRPMKAGSSAVRLESLALKYRWTIERLEAILGTTIRTIHVVGGGTRNTLLCQFTADACGRPVHAGPVEATAAGNVLLQAMARGRIDTLADARAIVAAPSPSPSTSPATPPRGPTPWGDSPGLLAH